MPLPAHDHLLTTRNGDQPEWWNVIVIPVTSAKGLATVEQAKDYATVKALETVPGSGIGVTGAREVPTNAYLWFQTLPGAGPATPGPVSSSCVAHLPSGSVVGGAALDDGTGYYEVDRAGDVAAFGAATCYGSLTGTTLNEPIVGMAVDRTDRGLLAGRRRRRGVRLQRPLPRIGQLAPPQCPGGRDRRHTRRLRLLAGGRRRRGVLLRRALLRLHGGTHLNQPIVGLGVDRATGGYWLVAADGGVFSYDAPFLGSTGAQHLNQPVVGIMPTSDGTGYRLVAADGGVFSFGRPFLGSAGSIRLNQPVVAGIEDNSYDGYWLLAADGGVFTYGPPGEGMPFFGSAA